MSNQDQYKNQQLNDEDDKNFQENLSKNFHVLPLFEREYFAYVSMKKNSLKNNDKLRTRWHERMMTGTSSGAKAMPSISDYHFHNSRTKFLPSQSRSNCKPPKFHLTPGPGFDIYGQRPIPDDMIMKRPKPTQPTTSKNKTKTLNPNKNLKSS